MAWTNAQKQLAARVCRSQQIADEHRAMILRQIPDQRAIHQGRPTSTSPRLTNTDFEQFMATVESYTPDRRLCLRDGKGHITQRWDVEEWARKLETGELARVRWKALRIAHSILAHLESWQHHDSPEAALRAWIRQRVLPGADPRQAHGQPETRLTRQELYQLVEGLKAYARRNGVELQAG